jgi:hypothetical protein
MDESESPLAGKVEHFCASRYSVDRIQYLLKTEEQIFQSISARAPISKILNDICDALDCQIGNTVSLISVPCNKVMGASEVSSGAALFGLHIFASVVIGAESVEELRSLEMYCCVLRNPSPGELQLIERAVCLAAVAIKRFLETGDGTNCRMHGVRSARGPVSEPRTSMN